MADARADHDVLGIATRRREQARDVGGEMLAVAIHRDRRVETEFARLAKTVA